MGDKQNCGLRNADWGLDGESGEKERAKGTQNCGFAARLPAGVRNADWGFSSNPASPNGSAVTSRRENVITLGMLVVGMVALLIVMAICLQQADQIEQLRRRLSAVEATAGEPVLPGVVRARAVLLYDVCDPFIPCGELSARDGRPTLTLYGRGLARATLTAGADAASLTLQSATGRDTVTLESRDSGEPRP